MSIVTIDCRERDLIESLNQMNYEHFESKSIPLGDILIGEHIIIERKTWSDLASSIMDGRYKEQSNRLSQALNENYKVYYFIEGNLDLYKPYGIKKETLISCIYSLTYEKSFNVIITKNLKETILFIIQFRDKYIRSETKPNIQINSSIVQKKKNSQIDPTNISDCMLCQIPQISSNTSKILLDHFGSIHEIFEQLKTNENLFEEFTYNKEDKIKHLNKNIIQNLNHFLRK
jgi:ERCC4-type nuclease